MQQTKYCNNVTMMSVSGRKINKRICICYTFLQTYTPDAAATASNNSGNCQPEVRVYYVTTLYARRAMQPANLIGRWRLPGDVSLIRHSQCVWTALNDSLTCNVGRWKCIFTRLSPTGVALPNTC